MATMTEESLQETYDQAKDELATDKVKKYDFSKSRLFHFHGTERVDIPGLEDQGCFIEIKKSVPFGIRAGLNGFAVQEANVVQEGRKQRVDKTRMRLDANGLFLYKVEHCIVNFKIVDPGSGKVYTSNGQTGHMLSVFKNLREEEFVEWINETIDTIVGWDKEAAQEEERFPATS
jgi:hypothetical protein